MKKSIEGIKKHEETIEIPLAIKVTVVHEYGMTMKISCCACPFKMSSMCLLFKEVIPEDCVCKFCETVYYNSLF